MAERPYTVLSCSMSLDGYLDDATDRRLILSNESDLDRVDAVRAASDAILVGAATVRCDDPRLLVRSAERRRIRVAEGLPPTPVKVTVTASGDLDPRRRFFARGSGDKLVYCPADVADSTRRRLDGVATVVADGPRVRMRAVAEDLHARGVRRLMVEGGGTLHTQFLADGLADELQLTVAPFFVGDSRARRFVGDARFPWCADHRARLVETRPVGDVVLLRYALSDRYDASRAEEAG
jgi:5-amino-6-(5-phosphoribosylamino)uracil reductase